MENKLNKFIRIFFYVLSVLYFLVASYHYLNRSGTAGGDEFYFIADLDLIQQSGWMQAIEKNISIPYLLLAYPFSLFLPNFVALRLVNVLLLICFFYYLKWSTFKNRLSIHLFYLLFYISAVGFFYLGTNDTLFFLSIAVFLIEVYKASYGRSYNFNLAFFALILSAFTRELFVVYIPIVMFGLFILLKTSNIKRRISRYTLFPAFLLVALLFLNIPSLLKNGSLSYDKKSPPAGIASTWSQRQYLAQLEVNQGNLVFHSHPSWEETDAYLKENGEDALPRNFFDGITHDLGLTFKEFFKDLSWVTIYHTRTLSLMLVFVVLYFARRFFYNPELSFIYFAPVSIITMILIFSFIIISYVELRWLAPIFILSIIVFGELEKKRKMPKILFDLNIYCLLFLTTFGLFRLLNKIV